MPAGEEVMKRFRLLLVTPEYHEHNPADEKTDIVEPIQLTWDPKYLTANVTRLWAHRPNL
jgi:hypothetical protein